VDLDSGPSGRQPPDDHLRSLSNPFRGLVQCREQFHSEGSYGLRPIQHQIAILQGTALPGEDEFAARFEEEFAAVGFDMVARGLRIGSHLRSVDVAHQTTSQGDVDRQVDSNDHVDIFCHGGASPAEGFLKENEPVRLDDTVGVWRMDL